MKDDKQEKQIFCIVMIIPIIWFALLIAPYISEGIVYGLSDILDALNKIAFKDDNQITKLEVEKVYGDEEKVYIRLEEY